MSKSQGEKDLTKLSFEEVMGRLEGVVQRLEQGDAPLEEALSTFEQGVALARAGNQRLDQAERRIEQLLKSGETEPLSTDDEEAPRKRRSPTRKAPSSKESTDDE